MTFEEYIESLRDKVDNLVTGIAHSVDLGELVSIKVALTATAMSVDDTVRDKSNVDWDEETFEKAKAETKNNLTRAISACEERIKELKEERLT